MAITAVYTNNWGNRIGCRTGLCACACREMAGGVQGKDAKTGICKMEGKKLVNYHRNSRYPVHTK